VLNLSSFIDHTTITTAFSIYSRQASVTAARSSFSIVSTSEIARATENLDINPSSKKALDWLLVYNVAGNTALKTRTTETIGPPSQHGIFSKNVLPTTKTFDRHRKKPKFPFAKSAQVLSQKGPDTVAAIAKEATRQP
jgi:hypothetical protein